MTTSQDKLDALRARTLEAAESIAMDAIASRARPPVTTWRSDFATWIAILALTSSAIWAPSSRDRNQRFDRGAAAAARDLVGFALRNLRG